MIERVKLVGLHDEIMTLSELSEYLKVSKRSIYRLVSMGMIPAFKLGNTWRFRSSEINRWISSGIGDIYKAS